MSKSTFKGSLLATTVIAGMALATPAFAQTQTTPKTAPPAPVTPTDTQGNTPPAAPTRTLPRCGRSDERDPRLPQSHQRAARSSSPVR